MRTSVVPLRRIAKVINGGTPTAEEANWSGEVPWATPVDLSRVDGRIVASTERTLTQRGLTSGSAQVPAGSLILSTRAPIGYVALTDFPMAFNQGCKGIVPGPEMDGRFLGYHLWANRESLKMLGSGSTFQELGTESLLGFGVPAPPIHEQRRIADFLDDQVSRLNQAITSRRQQLKLVELRRRSRLVTLMFGDKRSKRPIGTLAAVRLGRQRSPEHHTGDFMTPYLRSANIIDGELVLDDVKEMNFDPADQRLFSLRPGDVLVTEGSGSADTVGATAVWNAELPGVVCFQNTLLRLRPRDSRVSADYLLWWARASYAAGAMKTWATGANILHLGAEGLDKMPASLLTPEEQAVIAAKATEDQQDHARWHALLKRNVDLLQERQRALITAAVTGELEVSTASARSIG